MEVVLKLYTKRRFQPDGAIGTDRKTEAWREEVGDSRRAKMMAQNNRKNYLLSSAYLTLDTRIYTFYTHTHTHTLEE